MEKQMEAMRQKIIKQMDKADDKCRESFKRWQEDGGWREEGELFVQWQKDKAVYNFHQNTLQEWQKLQWELEDMEA